MKPSNNNCTDYASTLDSTSLQATCTMSITVAGTTIPGGTYSSAACPTANLVASCATSGGSTTRYYSTGASPFTLSSAVALCALATGTFSPNGGATGPMDGVWKVSDITCNGLAGNTSVQAGYSGSTSETYSVFNTIGTYSHTASGCTSVIPTTYAYSGTTLTMNISGFMGCTPFNCATGCDQFASVGPYTYTFGVSGNTLNWTSQGTSDNTCTTATPAQANPVGYTMTKQ